VSADPAQGKLLDDAWIQVLGFLAVASGLFSAHYLQALPRPHAEAPSTVEAVKPPIVPEAAPEAAPAPPPALPAPPVPDAPKKLVARRAGHWVVDAAMGPGADTAKIGEAIASAADLDVILVKPGDYREGLRITNSVTIVGDSGAPGDTRLSFAGSETISVAGGSVIMKNMTLSNDGKSGEWVIALRRGRLSLKDVALRSSSQGIRVADGDLDVADSTLEASTALFVEGKSRVAMTGVTATGGEATIRADGPDVELTIRHATVRNSRDTAVAAANSAHVFLSEIRFHDDADAIVAQSGAEVKVSHAKIEENHGCAVTIGGGATVILEQTRSRKDRCGVSFTGPGTLDVTDSEFEELELGSLTIKPGIMGEVVVRGARNTGIKIPRKVAGVAPVY
jgi:hypothetical protein